MCPEIYQRKNTRTIVHIHYFNITYMPVNTLFSW